MVSSNVFNSTQELQGAATQTACSDEGKYFLVVHVADTPYPLLRQILCRLCDRHKRKLLVMLSCLFPAECTASSIDGWCAMFLHASKSWKLHTDVLGLDKA